MTEHVVVECVDHKCVILVTHTMHTYTYIHRVMSSQPTFSHKYSLQPGDEETTVTASTLNEMDREKYETLFADVLISYELLEIGESIGGGRHNNYSELKQFCRKSCIHWICAQTIVL